MVYTNDMVSTDDMVYAVDMWTWALRGLRGMRGTTMGKTRLRAETTFGK